METPISGALNELAKALEAYMKCRVNLGHPSKSDAEVFIFPYQLSEMPTTRRTPAESLEENMRRSYSISCLLLPSPPETHSTIDSLLQFLVDTPLLKFPDHRATLVLDSSLDTGTISQIFASANIELTLSVPVVISINPIL